MSDRTLVGCMLALLFILGIVILLIGAYDYLHLPPKAEAATLRLSFHAPVYNADNGQECGRPDSTFLNPDSTLYLGTPLTDLKEVRIYGWRFTDPESVLIGPVPCAPGDSVAVDLEILPGTMGVFYTVAVDSSGNESCIGGQYVFALPAVDPGAAAAIEAAGYEIVWKKP